MNLAKIPGYLLFVTLIFNHSPTFSEEFTKIRYDDENFILIPSERGKGYSFTKEECGDPSNLKLIVRMEEKVRSQKHFYYVHFFLKNDSDREVVLSNSSIRGINGFIWHLNLSVTDNNENPVEKTVYGQNFFPPQETLIINAAMMDCGLLQPGKEVKIYSPEQSLGQYFDLSRPGEYSLVAILPRNFYPWDPPLKSESLKFRIPNGPGLSSSDLRLPGWSEIQMTPQKKLDDLAPSGDYSKLKYVLRTNKTRYKEAEPVFLRLFLKNESNAAVNVCIGGDLCWSAQSWLLLDAKDAVIPKTRLGKIRFPDKQRDAGEIDWMFAKPCFVKLEPGEEVEMEPGEIQLNLYYDMSQPGKYSFKCLRSTVIPGQKFDVPLESNTVEFEIGSGYYFNWNNLVEPDDFENPPDKEKQP